MANNETLDTPDDVTMKTKDNLIYAAASVMGSSSLRVERDALNVRVRWRRSERVGT